MFLLRVRADRLLSNAASEDGSVHVRLIDLASELAVEADSGRYVAPDDFAGQMQAAREGMHLAIGRRAAEFPLLLQIRGYRLLLACPIRSVDAVEVQAIDH